MQVKDKVFILKTVRYGEADIIVHAFSSTGARLNLFARSAVKSKKRFGGGVLEPTHYIHVLYEDKTSKRSENPLHTLKEASLIEGFEGLRTDYSRIEAGLYILQLIAEVVREGEVDSIDLFNLLGNALRATELSADLKKLRIHFEVKLLANQGVLPPEDEAEQILIGLPISAHEAASLTETDWARVQGRTKRHLAEYLGHQKA
jgi:DNA repair protein RecO (recombination protein O)